MAEIFKGKKYSLTDAQIKGLANICYREQGSGEAGVRACATHMLNYYEKYQTKKYSNPYDCTIKSGWYGTEAFNKPYLSLNNTPSSVIEYVKDVILNGNRSLPSWIDEYDCLSDVKSASNNGVSFTPTDRSKYKKDVTKVTNVYGSTWTFYCFPDGANGYTDAFGYISKPSNANNTATSSTNTTNTSQASAESASSIIEKAIKWMENLANDSSHGYDQIYRWGEKGDYDCSSAVITAWQTAGIPVKTNGATYTGNMYSVFTKLGFKDVTSSINLSTGSGLKRGDILLNHQRHVAMFCGDGKEVEASINEKGGATGGTPGDQTGKEILIRSYRNYPWNVVLRFTGGTSTSSSFAYTGTSKPAAQTVTNSNPDKVSVTVTEVSNGVQSASVLLVQKLLRAQGYKGADGKELDLDGEAGNNTVYAIKQFQSNNGLTVDGIAGKNTLKALLKGLT